MNAKAFAMRVTHTRFVGYVYAKLTTAFCMIYYSTDKMAEKKLTLAENGRQKICICRKKAVPL